MVLLFWCRLTPVLLEKRPLNERSSSSCCQNDWLSASDKTYRKENGKVKYVTHMLRDYHVRSSVSCCVKNGSYSSPNLEWKLSDWQYCWNILLSQQILDAMMKHVIEGDFIFQQYSALTLTAFNTVQLLQCKTPIFFSFCSMAPKWSRTQLWWWRDLGSHTAATA